MNKIEILLSSIKKEDDVREVYALAKQLYGQILNNKQYKSIFNSTHCFLDIIEDGVGEGVGISAMLLYKSTLH